MWEGICRIKIVLVYPLILVCLKENSPFTLYLAVSDKAINSVLVQDSDEHERLIYFVRKVLKGAEICYQKIELQALVVVITARKIIHYFQGHPIIVKTNYPIKRILKNPNFIGRMVAWAIDLSDYDITFILRTSIKSQIQLNFLIELSSPIPEESTRRRVLYYSSIYNELWNWPSGS